VTPSVPTGSVAIERDAVPLLLNAELPSMVVACENVTVPVGVPLALEVTVAVNVTDWLKLDGFGVETKVTVVLPCCTAWLNTDEVLALKLASPLYVPVMLCVPTARVEMDNVATPLEFSDDVPICSVPSWKVTCPVGVPEVPEATLAVKVTVCPSVDGFTDEVNVVVVFAFCTT
jgi:hypothetical protein